MLGVSTARAIVIRKFYCRNWPMKTTARFFPWEQRLTHLPWGGNGGVVEFDSHCRSYFPLPLKVRSRLACSASVMLQTEKQEAEVGNMSLKIKARWGKFGEGIIGWAVRQLSLVKSVENQNIKLFGFRLNHLLCFLRSLWFCLAE